MIDSRITGAYISRLRREKDWTQLEMADRLNVSHQAVSRWETGESFPDISLLVTLAQVFNVSVDSLLNGEKVMQPDQPHKATTGDIVTALASGHPENVARMVREDQADFEEVLEAAPLTRPSTMGKVVENLGGYKFTLEQVLRLAPFVGREALKSIVNESIAGGEIDRHLISGLAPFLDQETLEDLVNRVIEGEIETDFLSDLAPFVSKSTLEKLVDHIEEGKLDMEHLKDLAPFLGKEALEKLVFAAADGKLDIDLLESLAPFLSKDTLNRLVDQAVEGKIEASQLIHLAPFLGHAGLRRIIEFVDAGSLSPEIIVDLAPFLDKETLIEMIRGSLHTQKEEKTDEI